MGDMVCALPALHALRRAWPKAHLTFVAAPLTEELLDGHADVDELVVFRKQEMWRPWRLAAFLRKLRRPRPDLAVVMTTVSFSTTSALLAWASGARLRVGGSSLRDGSQLSRAIYHLELPLGPEGVHEVEHNLAPLRALGIPAPLEPPQVVPRTDAVRRARDFVERTFPGASGPLLVVHAGAGKLPNIWPARGFVEVIETLWRERRARVVLLEGPSDAAAVSALASALSTRLGGDESFVAPRWRAVLGDTLGLLSVADLALCNDTGIAHVAAAVGLPTVVLFGPTDAERWRPFGEHVIVVRSRTGWVDDLDSGQVLTAVRAGLDLGTRPTARGFSTAFHQSDRADVRSEGGA
jgi:ADP-heptose:LPS heptosyltransferase